MTFSVTVDGPRIKATFSRDTVSDAIDKARELVGRGVVTITDPNGKNYSQYQLIELQARWAAKTKSALNR